ncbi:MAG: acetolactate synthase 2 catalytic subunit [Gammaproteobacteria bacterium]|nr:acetolactate synthase 2 catalytic subunit [Gammaproteobacteria bacterium]
MNGAKLVIKLLKEQDVSRVFGYPGGAIMPVYDALYESGIEHILSRHEQGAGFAALGYAKITGKPSVCIATSGPGATNLITAIADAQFDSIPMVVITGQVASEVIGTDAFQEIDMLGLSLAVTKHSFLVETQEQLAPIVLEAFKLAQEGRPGPVLIDIPKDIQLHDAVLSEIIVSEKLDKEDIQSVPLAVSEEAIKNAVALIHESKHPVFYIGGGVLIANAEDELNQLLEYVKLPVVSTLKGLGAVSLDNELNLGMLGMHGNQAANHTVQECDLLIAVGARFDDRVTGKLSGFAANAKVIHFDIDAAEVDKLRKADVPLIGELKPHLLALTKNLSDFNPEQYTKWRTYVAELKKEYRWAYNKPGDAICARQLLMDLSGKITQPSIVATDVGQHQMWTAQHMSFSQQSRLLTSGGLGTMGYGIPVAIGAQFAEPDSLVVAVCGDGSFMMNVQELATIKRYQIPIKILLLDNQKLGMVKQWQQIFFEKRYSETDLSDNPDFVQLAKAFNIEAESISSKEQVSDALDRMLNSTGAFLLHIKIESTENVWPLVPPGATNEQMMEKIYDAYI